MILEDDHKCHSANTCHASCLTCSGVNDNDCLTCPTGHQLVEGRCVLI